MIKPATGLSRREAALPASFLNCYEITSATDLEWYVRTYKVTRQDGRGPSQEDRSAIKNVLWKLRAAHKERCPGRSFVIDIDPVTVAVPDDWDLPVPLIYGNYEVREGREITVNAAEPQDGKLFSAIIREGLKSYLKSHASTELGPLWQDYNSFCQVPDDAKDGVGVCRKFDLSVKLLRGGVWTVECAVSTTLLDGMTLADYYQQGQGSELARLIKAKQTGKSTRQGQPAAVRVLWREAATQVMKVVELVEPGQLIRSGTVNPNQQKRLADAPIWCKVFGRDDIKIPLAELNLILGTQAQEDHAEAILAPDKREQLMKQMRDFINGSSVFGECLFLANAPFDAKRLRTDFVLPPNIWVRGPEPVIRAPRTKSESQLRNRMRERSARIRRNGFLQQRPINPVLTWPYDKGGEACARRHQEDLHSILEAQNIHYRFELFRYKNVEELRREIERRGYDAVLAVLPESWQEAYQKDDTHEQIKQRIEVPSQCMYHDRTLSREWVERSVEELEEKDLSYAKRIRQRYELCLIGLLVKHHWVPFAPAEPFHYNVQIGIDVGGKDNNEAFSCFGYGFQRPAEGLFFRPEKISVDGIKAEPLPPDSLYMGLLKQFEMMHERLIHEERVPAFERTLFVRDGQLLGEQGRCNEIDDLKRLRQELLTRGWITNSSVWTAVEIRKTAEGWRLFNNDGTVKNPLAGEVVFPYDDDNIAIVCTTGRQFLSQQGTANPIMAQVVDIYGRAVPMQVMRDVVWGADMCFTKPDMGMRLPWVLNVADTGALQQARDYQITGITAS